VRVYVKPVPTTLSMAMHRVAWALKKYAPKGVTIVENATEADLQFIHTIGPDSIQALQAPNYVVIQYCLFSADGDQSGWQNLWTGSQGVWSYYDLKVPSEIPYIRTPLGIAEAFLKPFGGNTRDIGAMTSGYVSGPGAEAIEEVAIATSLAGKRCLHLGPRPTGMGQPPLGWSAVHGVSDEVLAGIYGRTHWVSGLRHVEGFEFPVIEGLSCGARPIVFDRPEMRHWFNGHARFVTECSGTDLVRELINLFKYDPQPVGEDELEDIRGKFSWANIIPQVWEMALSTSKAGVR
jgi:hypothetical protein